MKVKPEVAAARFFRFVGATLAAVGALLLITMDFPWFWIMFGVGWMVLFFGLWSQGAIKMGIDQKEAEKAAKAAQKKTPK